ncbi:MAG: chromosomal replication initiator protein DnaA, partial [Flavobacteriales bacterium]|nr:chromosomal replication initiator protein DnaA [Flavobacteriales bacterium]
MNTLTCQEVWDKCLNVIKDNVSPQNFKTWFEPITPVDIKEKTLTIQVPTAFFFEYLEEHYITLIRKTIKRFLGKDGKLDYNIVVEGGGNSNPYITNLPSNHHGSVKNNPISMPIGVSSPSIRNPFIIPGLQKININPQLNPSYTFDAFVEGECNRLARSAGYA